MAYDVLVRIADGLGIPRGYLGLTHDPETAELLARSRGADPERADGREVSQLIAHAAQVTMGTTQLDGQVWSLPVPREAIAGPSRIGLADVEQLETVTGMFRALDYQDGGGACRDAVIAQVGWGQQLLSAASAEEVGRRLQLAVADLHNLAGWTSFDVGLHTSANQHFLRALELARHVNDSSLVANVLYRLGRLQLHKGQALNALKLFQLGQIAAQDSGCELTVAMLCVNEAVAYAVLDDSKQALKSVGRAQDEFARAVPETAPTWVRFFGAAELDALSGLAYAALARTRAECRVEAISALNRSLAARGAEMDRSRAFEMSALATVHLLAGDIDHGAVIGRAAVDMAVRIRSIRISDRLTPLYAEARKHPRHADSRDLAERITTLRAG